jgi:putative ABC transport system permease protein
MNRGNALRLSLKYLWLYKRRYIFLFIALAFGFGVITLISAEKDGIYKAVYLSAQGHYSGDLTVLGRDASLSINGHMNSKTMALVKKAASLSHLNPERTVMRTVVSGSPDTTVYYSGSAVPLLHLMGVDWAAEKEYFDSMAYTEKKGGNTDDTVILSKPAADAVGVHAGDRVLLEVRTCHGQVNTGYFTVASIMRDLSIFGYYKAFISRKALNKLILFPENECSVIGYYFKSDREAQKKCTALYNELKKLKANLAPLPKTRRDYENSLGGGRGDRLVLITIPVYLTEVSDFLDSLDILSVFLRLMMLLIIFVSTLVTCNLIIRERGKDIGTMRSIGFYESDVRFILFSEVTAAGTLAVIAGFLLSLLGAFIISRLSFTGISGFDMFLKGGRMTPLYEWKTFFSNILGAYCALFLASIPLCWQTSRVGLPKLLAGGVKE